MIALALALALSFPPAIASGQASWYGTGGPGYYAAVPGFVRPFTATVRHGGHTIHVRVVTSCGCGNRPGHRSNRIIDLSPAAFRALGGSLSAGVMMVTVERP